MNSLKSFLKHLFVPHEGNNFKARALHIDFLTYYLIFAFFLSFGFKTFSATSGEVLGFATDISIDKLYQLTNTVRQENQLSTLTYNEQLALAAQKKAQDMFQKNYWSHYGPDGATPWDFILASGYKYEFAGENLAKNFLFSQGVVDAWMASPSHKENILRKDYSEVGFAVVNGLLNGEETTLVVEMFGKPLATTASVPETAAPEKLAVNQPEVRPLAAEAKSVEEVKTVNIPKQAVLAQNTQPTKNVARLLSFNSSFIFLSFLLLTLILDMYFARKLKVIRISGKNFAHLIFIGFMFIGLFIIIKGSIL